MSKRLVDIDDDLLEEASTVLGAATMKEADKTKDAFQRVLDTLE